MRRNEVNHFEPLPEERLTIPSLGGDGMVLVRSIGFGGELQMSLAEAALRPSMLLAACVRDEDGAALMDAKAWDVFGLKHQEDYFALSAAARRVSGFDQAEVKKD